MSISLKKTCTKVCSEIPFSENSYRKIMQKLVNWLLCKSIDGLHYDRIFCWKVFPKHTLITATVINCKIKLVLYFFKIYVSNNRLMDWGEGGQVQIWTFFIVSTNMVWKSLMYLHHVNSIEPDIKLSMLAWGQSLI